MSPDSSVGVVNRVCAGELRNCSLILVGGKRFFSSPKYSHQLWGPHSPQFNGYWQFFLRGELQGLEADSTVPASVKVKNKGMYISIPLYSFMACKGTTLHLPFYFSK
jgi:hypothetical protein